MPEGTERDLVLLDLLDRALDKGVVLYGELVLSVADIDLVYVGVKVLLSSVDALEHRHRPPTALPPTTAPPTAPADSEHTADRDDAGA